MNLTYEQCLEAKKVLSDLMDTDLPVKIGLDIARLSNIIDEEAKIYAKAAKSLIKNYEVKPTHSEGSMVSFTSDVIGKNDDETRDLKKQKLLEWTEKMTTLLESTTKDINVEKIQIPADMLSLSMRKLKPIADFIEVT